MQKKGSSRKSLIIGIIAAIVVLGVVLALVLTQCTGQGTSTDPSATGDTTPEVPTYELYWNADRALYDGKSEAGMSSRMPESDGYFHVRFILDGEEVVLKVQDRKIINKIDVMDLMGLVIDDNGIVVDAMDIKEMPLEKIAWQFYVQSAGKTLIKANSSDSFAGMEVQLEIGDNSGVYDMTGKEGDVGCVATPIEGDRIYGIANLAGEVTHVFIYERPTYMLTHEGECQHCKKTVTWYEWVRTDSLPVKSGHFQLMNDVQLIKQQSMSVQDQKICLDLNGKRVDGKSGARVYSMHNAGSHLAIMDTSEGQTGVLAAHGKGDQGMVVWVRYGQFHFYGGTLDASDATTKIYGTAVSVQKNTYMYMYGGTIIGGTASYVKNAETGKYSRGYAGSMYIGGKFVMHDGEIRDGFAQSVTYKKNGTSTTTRGYGGNLFVTGTAEVELNGGTIKNGKAGSAGGNIYSESTSVITINGAKIKGGHVTGKGKNGGSIYIAGKSTVNLKSGSISGGYSYNAGGNIYVNGTFNMTGGTVSGGKCYNYTTKKLNETSTNFNLFVVNGTFKMYGGRIQGGVGVTDTSSTDKKTATVRLATNAVIKSDVEGVKNLTLNTGGIINCRVDKLRDKASIGVNTARGLFTNPTLQENTDNFFSDIEGAEVIYTENGLFLGREKCVCGKETHINGCDGTKYLWGPWISATSLPKVNGNYYLTKDVTTTGQIVVSKGNTVRLDLNGFDTTYNVSALSSDGYRLYRSAFESLLVITDTTDAPGSMRSVMKSEAEVLAAVQAKLDAGDYDQAKADAVIKAQKAGNFGQVLWARGGDIVMHNGILDGSNLNGSKSGMTVYVAANTAAEDGGVTRKGSFTMYGGTIKGATSTASGCSLYSTSNGIINIHGGIIEGGVSTKGSGGNVYTLGEFYMDGGVIRDGVAYSSGGNLLVDGAKANATITGNAKILNGQAGDPTLEKDIGRGGNIRVTTKGAKLTIGGDALISGGIAYRSASDKGGYGGNISVNTDTTMVMTGGTVADGVSEYRSGNIDVCGILQMEGGTVTGGKARYGGNIYVLNGSNREFIMTGGTVEKGHATGSGGNIYALAPVTVSGGVIAEGKAIADSGKPGSNQGGNIYTFSTLTITGEAVVRDGYTCGYGGNIAGNVDGSLKANITISGKAQILNGKVDGQKVKEFDGGYGGNIRMASNTSLTVKDDVLIAGGSAIGGTYNSTTGKGGGGQGGNIYLTSAKVQLLGGIIENGTANGGGGNIGSNSPNGSLVLENVIVRNGNAGTSYGGNIRARGDGIKLLQIKGDTQILNGDAKYGGNICIEGKAASTIEMSGNAKIAGGQVSTGENGPNVYLSTNADFSMTDNAVIDATGSVGKRGGAVYMASASANFTMDGDSKLIGTKEAAMTHGGAAYLRTATIGGNAQIIAGDGATYGNGIYMHSGTLTLKDNALVDATGTKCSYSGALHLYGGEVTVQDNVTIKGGEASTNGGAIKIDANSSLLLNGGVIENGKSTNGGGNIFVSGDLEINNAIIRNGESVTTSGGNLYLGDNSETVMNSGSIEGGMNGREYTGSSKPNGGSIYVGNKAVFTLNDGSITGGKTINTGGNMVVYGDFVMNGGRISGGAKINSAGEVTSTTASNANVYVISGNMTMSGGSIDGRVAVYGDSKLNLSGNVNLHTEDEVEGDLFLNGVVEPITITGSLGQERLIATIRTYDMETILSTETDADNAKYFASYDPNLSIFHNADSKLELGKVQCICGYKNGKHIGDCNGDEYQWHAWTNTKYLPTTTGYYYLTADLEIGGTSSVASDNQKIALDLNGYTIYGTAGASRVFSTYNGTYQSGTELTILNSGDTGKIQGWNKGGTGKTAAENGSILWAASKNTTFNLYNVILDASKNKPKDGVVKNGMAVMLSGTGSKLNVFSSTLMGGDSPRGDAFSGNSTKTDQRFRLEGDVTIIGTKGSSLFVGGEGCTVDVSKLDSLNAPISVEATGVFTTNWNKDTMKIEDYFVSFDEGFIIVEEGGQLAMRPYHCICDMPDGKHVEGFCDGTKHAWTPWTETEKVPTTSGYYYLTDDVTSNSNTIKTAQNIVIDLNGFDITRAKGRMYSTLYSDDRSVPVNFVLTNTASDDESTIKVTAAGDQGHIVWLSGYNKSLKVNNLTVDTTAASYNAQTYALHGKAFSVSSQSTTDGQYTTLEIYNTVFNAPDGSGTGVGSVISASDWMGQTVKLKDVTINGGYGYQVKKDTTDTYFGNGGAIQMYNGDLIMENVTINGAKAKLAGGAIYLDAKAHATMSGKIVIDGELIDGTPSGIHVAPGATIDVADLTSDSKITVSGEDGYISANTYAEDDADLKYVTADNASQFVILVDGKMYLKGLSCLCGSTNGKHVEGFCDGTLLEWEPWTNTTKAPDVAGNYLLTAPLTVSKTAYVYKEDMVVNLDLNGFDITVPSFSATSASRLFSTYYDSNAPTDKKVSVNLTNHASTATITVAGGGDEGRVAWLTGTNKSFAAYKVNINLKDAKTRPVEDSYIRKDGVGFNIGGTGSNLELYKVNITGGTTNNNGNVLHVKGGSTALLKDCSVDGCKVEVGKKWNSTDKVYENSGGYGGFAYVGGTLKLVNTNVKNISAAKGAGAIYVYGSSSTRAKLIIEGGSFDNIQALAAGGGIIDAQSYADVEMNGVTLSKGSSAVNGGAIQILTNSTAKLTECEIKSCSAANGGAIYVNRSSEKTGDQLVVNGCSFEECTATNRGGAIVTGATDGTASYSIVKLNDTTFTSCSSEGKAGAVHVCTSSTVVLDGCTIEKCTNNARAGAIYNYQGNLTVLNSSIKNNSVTGSSGKGGAIYLYGAGITVGGKIVITDNTATVDGNNVYLNGQKIVVSTEKPLADSSVIGVSPETGYKPTISTTVSYAQKDLFVSDHDTLQIVHNGTNLKFADAAEHWHCICGGEPTADPDHECVDVLFTAIDSLDQTSIETGKYYYMTDSFTIGGTEQLTLSGETVTICLNGKTLTPADGKRAFLLAEDKESTLTLTSCKAGANIPKAANAQGGIVHISANAGTLNLYNVTLNASNAVLTTSMYGTAVHSKDTINLYSGTIIGSKTGTDASHGGAVTAASGSLMNMYGGTIQGGKTSGRTGGLYASGTVNIYDGVIENGVSTYTSSSSSGGNVAVVGTVNLYGGIIRNGEGSRSGNIGLSGTLNMSGGYITGGKSGSLGERSFVANIRINGSGKLNMTGGTIDGHVYAGPAGAAVKLSGDAKIFHSGCRGLWAIQDRATIYIGDLSDKAQIEILVMNDSDKSVFGQFAQAMDDYQITEQDVSRITVIEKENGNKIGNVVLNDDNTLSVVELD